MKSTIPPWKWIMGIISAVGTLVTGTERIIQLGAGTWKNLNPWTFTFCLFALMLAALGVASYTEKLNARFDALSKELKQSAIDIGHSISGVSTQCDSRIGTIVQDFDSRLTALSGKMDVAIRKEQDSRAAAHGTAVSMITEVERKLGEFQKKITSSSSASGAQSG